MISKQEVFGAGDLRANEELKGVGKKENALTKEWLLEQSENLVREKIKSDTFQNWPTTSTPYTAVLRIGKAVQSANEQVYFQGWCEKEDTFLVTLIVSPVQVDTSKEAAYATELHYVVLDFEIENDDLGTLTKGLVDQFY